MRKTTIYLPDNLEARLEAESAASGTSKAELIRRGIAMLLDHSSHLRDAPELPVFDSGRPLSSEAMDDAVYEHIKERASRR